MVAAVSLEECLEKIRSGPVPPNEESVKFQVIAPVLRSLDWNPDDGSEFLLEHSVGTAGRRGGRIDIALRSGGRFVALVEAKASRTDLGAHVEQALRYDLHKSVDICVLTNGLEWWLFLPRERGNWEERRFAVLDLLNDPVERLAGDLRAFLHKGKLVNGEAESNAQQVLNARRKAERQSRRSRLRGMFAGFGSTANSDAARLEREIPKIWRQMLSEPDDELVELIRARVHEKLELRPERSQVIAVLGGRKSRAVRTSNTPTPQPVRSGDVVAFTLWGERYPVSTQKGAYAGLVDCLYERHVDDFDRVLELGGETPYVALDPKAFWGHHQVKSSRYFLDTGTHTHTLVRRAGVILECFGYDKSDFEILFE